MKTDEVAYIAESDLDLLSSDSIDTLFNATYTANNPKLLVDVTELVGLSSLKLTPPWGDDLSVFSSYVIRNFVKILVGYMGTRYRVDLRYGAWLMKDVDVVKRYCRENALRLDIGDAYMIYDAGDGRALYMYNSIPKTLGTVNPKFTVVK